MIYAPLQTADYLSNSFITTEFEYGVPGEGTGFFVKKNDLFYFVTARHLIDDNHKPPNDRNRAKLSRVTLSCFLRGSKKGTTANAELTLVNEAEPEVCSDDNDLAIMKLRPEFVAENQKIFAELHHFDFNDLCHDDALRDYRPGEPVFICGYSADSPKWGDQEIQFPFMRSGTFATPPNLPVRQEGYLGKDYCYLDAFALSGFSGCPVIAPEFGLPAGGDVYTAIYRPRKVVGMIVKRVNKNDGNDGGKHAGLSCYVTTRAIRQLIGRS